MSTNNQSTFRKIAGPMAAGMLIAVCAFTMCASDAMAGRGGGGGGRGGGGGARGGGGGGHGGRMAQSSVSGGNRGGGSRSSAGGGGRSAGGGQQRSGGGSTARGGGDRGGGDRGGGDRTRNGGDRTRTSGDRTNNIGSNNNVNIEGRDVNVDVEGGCCGYGGGWGYRHPVAAGVTIGAIAGMTAAAFGSYYYALPPSGCVTVVRAGANYYQCGSAYYQEAMNGDEVVYMSVDL